MRPDARDRHDRRPRAAGARHAPAPLRCAAGRTSSYYHATMGRLLGVVDAVVSRTGYTGEDGFELIVPAAKAVTVWDGLARLGARPRRSFRADWARGTRSGSRRRCPSTATNCPRRSTPTPRASAGPSSSTRGSSSAARRSVRSRRTPARTRIGLRLDGKRIARQGCAGPSATAGPSGPSPRAPSPRRSARAWRWRWSIRPLRRVGTRLTVDVRGHDEPAQVVGLPFYRRDAAAGTGTPAA